MVYFRMLVFSFHLCCFLTVFFSNRLVENFMFLFRRLAYMFAEKNMLQWCAKEKCVTLKNHHLRNVH